MTTFLSARRSSRYKLALYSSHSTLASAEESEKSIFFSRYEDGTPSDVVFTDSRGLMILREPYAVAGEHAAADPHLYMISGAVTGLALGR